MSTHALALFRETLQRVSADPQFPARGVITSQLEYLIDLLEGRADRSNLAKISLGLFAVRNLPDDSDIQKLFIEAQDEVSKMQSDI
jgi:hypothetical protein